MVSKKYRRLTRIFLLGGLAVAIAALASFVLLQAGGNRQSLANGPRFSVGPDSVSPGATIMVTGFEYPGSTSVRVYFQEPSNGVVNTVTNAGGFFDVPLTLPNHINSGSRVYVVNGTRTSSALVSVAKPSLTTSAGASSPTLTVVSGSGFVANQPVTLTLNNGTSVVREGTVMADKQGHIASNVTLPDVPFGTQETLIASDAAHNVALMSVHSQPVIKVSPSSGYRGASITVSGKGFGRIEHVTISFQGQVVATQKTSANGRFSVSFIVPQSATGGSTTIVAVGTKSGATASAPFEVGADVTISPHSGPPGQVVTATGGQFTPNGTVQISLQSRNDSSVGYPLETIQASASGTIQTQFTIPNVPRKQPYNVVFIDVSAGTSTSIPFAVR